MSTDHDKIGIVLLAAGLSRRMGKRNKLLIDVCGQPMIKKVAGQLLAAGIGPVVAVTGHQQAEVTGALTGMPLSLVHNGDYNSGQMGSVRRGCAAFADRTDCAGIMIALGDMPDLTPADYRTLRDAFVQSGANQIAIPYFDGARGNPIIIPWNMVHEIIDGDLNAGCRKLVAERPADILKVPATGSAFIADVDNPGDLARLTSETADLKAG